THLMDNAERMCDAVCIIARGEKVLDGPVAAVRDGQGRATVALALEQGSPGVLAGLLTESPLVHRVDDHNRYFEVELARGADPQQLLRDLVGRGVALRRFELVQPSLHQIFLKKVGARGVEEGMSGQG
ncbi:MAG TPA: DUF4162 domain-containing protein, partial [Gemmatimonadaceae bacterium]|nr:DUF4162 domain-containing protein [Gemmatimonadaceae bacterium]